MGIRCSRKVCRWAVAGLMVVSVTGCRSTAMTSPATPAVVTATPTIATPLPPSVPGLSTDEVASLDSLARLDAYPLFTMHLYGAGRETSSLPAVIRTEPSVWACSLFAALGDADHRLFGGEVSVIPNEGPWHLATNHYRTPLREGETGGCSRYAKLDTVLTATSGTLRVADALALLTDVDQSSTQWSIVYDMSAREIHVSMGRAYAQVHNFALRKE